ncbi:13999_t:CDS:2 [Funneliformis caledonium]|uniref:13999_t:CDS:1 n=1 Tax=Funneliformis caledonium TaxID=1117310 RepID=A0A9N8V2K6_9GLOM|nr:13999_t:CDS:2 [Funneliformis caledonium]
MDQAENNYVPSSNHPNNIDEQNVQRTSINNVDEFSNIRNETSLHVHDTVPVNQNFTYEFYLPTNDARIYHVTYTELPTHEIARRLNSRINLSHVPEFQFPYHYNIQSLIHQRIQQQLQQTTTSQAYSENPIYNEASTPSSEVVSDIMQDTQDMGCDEGGSGLINRADS